MNFNQTTVLALVEPSSASASFLVFHLAPFRGCFFLFLFALLAALGLGLGSDALLGPTYVDNQLWLCKYIPVLLILIRPHLKPFYLFLGPLFTKPKLNEGRSQQ